MGWGIILPCSAIFWVVEHLCAVLRPILFNVQKLQAPKDSLVRKQDYVFLHEASVGYSSNLWRSNCVRVRYLFLCLCGMRTTSIFADTTFCR